MSKAWTKGDDRWFTALYGEADPWPYPWTRDGVCYRSCYRCGIRMELPDEHLTGGQMREFCIDCNYPEFRAPFEREFAFAA